jgi:Kef-type K+ transport system membrane component KefB
MIILTARVFGWFFFSEIGIQPTVIREIIAGGVLGAFFGRMYFPEF